MTAPRTNRRGLYEVYLYQNCGGEVMPQSIRRPRALKPGDTIAVLSPSSGAAHAYPHIYEQGLATLRGWGLRIKEYPTTRMSGVATS